MAKYVGPKCRQCRREGTKLFLKGEKCYTSKCSVENRALIRFGEETTVAGVSASMSTGTLEFVSDGPGSGACYLTCHGVDHGPEAYGSMKTLLRMLGREGLKRNQLTTPPRFAPDRAGGAVK